MRPRRDLTLIIVPATHVGCRERSRYLDTVGAVSCSPISKRAKVINTLFTMSPCGNEAKGVNMVNLLLNRGGSHSLAAAPRGGRFATATAPRRASACDSRASSQLVELVLATTRNCADPADRVLGELCFPAPFRHPLIFAHAFRRRTLMFSIAPERQRCTGPAAKAYPICGSPPARRRCFDPNGG
jgi:hypothetical protein